MKNIRITIILCSLLLISAVVVGQKKELQVLHTETILGKNLINDNEIIGNEYTFPNIIHEVFYLPEANYATVQLKGKNTKGNILQYDMQNKKIVWSKAIDYSANELLMFDNLLILNEYNESYVLNNHTGENLSIIPNYIYFAKPKYNIGIAYRYISDDYTNELMGIDLIKRKLVWKRIVNRTYGWNDFFYLNDSLLMVVASGLHLINIKTGDGWDYNAITGEGKENAGTGPVFGVIGAMMGGLIGAAIGGAIDAAMGNTTVGSGVKRDVVSNALFDNNFIYLASQDKLAKIEEKSGNIVWENSFPKDLTSKSSLFIDGNIIYMVNYGYAMQGGRKIGYGKLFIAAFDKQTGKQKYLSLLDYGFPIIDFKQMGKEIFLLNQQNVIVKYNLETGNYIAETIFPEDYYGDFLNVADSNLFFTNKNGYLLNLVQNDPENIHFNTSLRRVISIDKELTLMNTVKYEDRGVCFLTFNAHKFIACKEKTFVINNEGKKVAELNISTNSLIIDGILYDKREKSFIVVDLQKVITSL